MTSDPANAVPVEDVLPGWIGGADAGSDQTIDVVDPGRPSHLVGRVAAGTPQQVDAAVEAAARVVPEWGRLGLVERLQMLGAAMDAAERVGMALVETLVAENGATRAEALADMTRSFALSRDILERAAGHLRPETLDTENDRIVLARRPIGVVGLVVPWNSPMVLAAAKIAPALAAGNAIVLKPSPEAPITLSLVVRALAAQLPAGVVNVINGGADVGRALSVHPGIGKVSFTGSTEVGKIILGDAAPTVKRVSLELGGNDPAIVLEDTDFAASIPSLARGVFTRAGQICFAVKRIYVARSRYDEFVADLTAYVDGFTVGYGLDDVSYGPLITAAQAARVRTLVGDARQGGARVAEVGALSPDADPEGHYLRPTIVSGVDDSAGLVTREQFGPAIPVLPFDGVEDAIRRANAGEFGLAASVWSAEEERAFGVAAQIEAGCTFINSHNVWSLSFDLPFGGVKQSGLGRERTQLGIDEYTEVHATRWVKPTR